MSALFRPSTSRCPLFRTHAALARRSLGVVGCALVFVIALAVATSAQQPARGRGAGPATGQIGGAVGAYPARPPADPTALERGKAAYGTYCTFCHGADIRGGDGGPSLLRSGVVLDDQNGELIGPVVRSGRQDRGMPPFALTPPQISDLST